MEVRYRREMNHNYMIIDAPAQELGYECRMLAGNHIEGLLKFRVRYGEEKREFYYEITSRQPLCRVLEKRKAAGEEIRRILLAVVSVMRRIEEYLLPEEQLLLAPEFLYVEPDSFDVKLCLLPGHTADWSRDLSALLQYLLEQADPQDKEALVLAYHLYRESLKENYGAADLMKYLAPPEHQGKEQEKEQGKERMLEKTFPMDGEISGAEASAGRGDPWPEEEKAKLVMSEAIAPGGAQGKGAAVLPHSQKMRMAAGRYVLSLLGVETVLWYLRGIEGLQSYGVFPVLAFLLFTAGKCFMEHRKRAKKEGRMDSDEQRKEKEERFSWELRTEREEDYQDRVRKSEEEEMKKSREEGTVLLADLGEAKGIARLEPLERDAEIIEIPYVPFVIGKHPQLTDYCLPRPTISRLHLRIDRTEQVCIVTDLNSTNGTSVNGYLLQANETVSVKTGDTICIADKGYRFCEIR